MKLQLHGAPLLVSAPPTEQPNIEEERTKPHRKLTFARSGLAPFLLPLCGCRLNLFAPAEQTQYLRTISGQFPTVAFHAPRSGTIAGSSSAAVPASVVLAPEPAPEPADTRPSKIAAAASGGWVGTARSSPGGGRGNQIIFLAMTLAPFTRR
jgi:hypothetical protein